MHEYGLALDVLNIILDIIEKEKIKNVYTVKLKVGMLMAVVPESLLFGFETIIPDTPLENARLEIQEIPICARCNDCGKSDEIEEFNFICLYCGGDNLEIISGKEMQITSIEVEKDGNYYT